MTYCSLDLETGIKEYLKRKGCYLVNDIVAVGLKYEPQLSDERDLGRLTGLVELYKPQGFQANWLNYVKVIVGHNIKFDLLHLWKYKGFQDWIELGGTIWDTQYAHYTITGQREKFSALRDIAVRCYGCEPREKLMEAYWDRGIDTKDIPKEIVLQDLKWDLLNTEQVYLKQLERAYHQKQIPLIIAEMDAIFATTEMEYNGMKVDLQVLQDNRKELQVELEQEKLKLHSLVKGYWK